MRKILVVDDNPTIIKKISKALSRFEVRLYGSKNGKEGFTLVKKHKPDLVIINIELPVKDGVAMYHKLRDHEKFKDTPIIFITFRQGLISPEIIKKLGIQGHIGSNFRGPELVKKIEAIFGPDKAG